MWGGPKIFAGAVVLLVAVALSACGGDSSGDGMSSTEAGKGQIEGKAAGFTPRQHHNSGGGSQQFIQKGGDNSVQEFGKEADPQEFEAAAAVLHDFLDARAEGNWVAACEYMSKTIVESFEKLAAQAKQLEGMSCAELLEKLTNSTAKGQLKEEAAKADVGSLRVEGGRAFAIYRGIKGTVLTMPMTDEDGQWRVASLAGTPLD